MPSRRGPLRAHRSRSSARRWPAQWNERRHSDRCARAARRHRPAKAVRMTRRVMTTQRWQAIAGFLSSLPPTLTETRISRGSFAPLFRRTSPRARPEAPLDIIDHDVLEIRRQRRATQRHRLLAVNEYRRGRLLAGAGQRNADIGVLGLARPVDDAAHHRDVEGLDAG